VYTVYYYDNITEDGILHNIHRISNAFVVQQEGSAPFTPR